MGEAVALVARDVAPCLGSSRMLFGVAIGRDTRMRCNTAGEATSDYGTGNRPFASIV